MKLSNQDRRDLDKFTKFLALKSTQIIIQSRLGEKVTTACKPTCEDKQDWFNLNIQDLPEVLQNTKTVLTSAFYTDHVPLCVEISLQTTDGDKMVLETWCLGLLPEQCETSARITHTVYNRMGILLKSLVSVTRVTPAYKLSRRQGPDSFCIFYRVYLSEPETHSLGDGLKQVNIGQICTPIGTIYSSVFYRTKMTISPTQTGKDNSIMLKSDHFNTNLSPKSFRYKQNDDRSTSLTGAMKLGAFANPDLMKKKEKRVMEEPELIVPFSRLLKISPDNNQRVPDAHEENEENESPKINGQTSDENKNGKNKDKDSKNTTDSRTSALTMFSTNDDFIMVDLKTPFASANANTNSELGKFYREWQTAPPLLEFAEMPPLAELDVAKQLETFESDLNEYDTIVQSLCQSPNNN